MITAVQRDFIYDILSVIDDLDRHGSQFRRLRHQAKCFIQIEDDGRQFGEATPAVWSISTGGPMKGTGMSSTGLSISYEIFASPPYVQDLPAKVRTARTNWPRKGADQ